MLKNIVNRFMAMCLTRSFKNYNIPSNSKFQKLFPLIPLLFLPFFIQGQPANDECINAIQLTELDNWCSAAAAYSTVGATESAAVSPSCFPTTQANNDIWFSFVAQATHLNVSVTGNTIFSPGGTLNDPQLAIYAGDCGSLTEIECFSDAFDINAAQTFGGPLAVGQTYYLRISAREGQTGTFQLCINNYNEIPQPSGDCPTGVILCDKSPFTVESVSGEGADPNEIDNTLCDNVTCNITESSSTWYKWTCDESGTLAFTLTPLNPTDDLDFVVYELPNGIDDCGGKFDLRCMASGENVGTPFSEWQPCTGQTGLSLTDNDNSETCGCQSGDNNFAKAIDMVAGRSYALVVNNFSQSGSGFSIEFGGTGTFLGPSADFANVPDAVLCIGEEVTFTDASTFIGDLVGWEWTFGPGASVTSANTQGPHILSYDKPGTKYIVMTVESDGGCLVTKIKSVTVECCDNHFSVAANITDLACPEIPTGAIDLTVVNDYSPYVYQWSTTEDTEDVAGLSNGQYFVTIVDDATCERIESFVVNTPPSFAFDTLINRPTCNGGTDGAATMIPSGGTPPYQYNWANMGFSNDNTLSNISNGQYELVVRDANGCETDFLIPVHELELILDPTVQAITPPTCFGFSDGAIEVLISNGLPNYQYDWHNGNGFVGENSLSNVMAGTFTVDVLDANLCQGSFVFDMQDHPPLVLDLDPTPVSCFGQDDGSLLATIGGGVGNYVFEWNNGQSDENAENLVAGDYTVTVLDGNDCEIVGTETVVQPGEIFIGVLNIIDNICFGYESGEVTVAGDGGTEPYTYSIDGENFQLENSFGNLPAGTYTFTISDANGCMGDVEATVQEPIELLVEAGPDIFIELGYSGQITASANDNNVIWAWTPTDSLNCMDCPNPVASPVNSTLYTIMVTDASGCLAVDSVEVRVIKDYPVYIPNAFSPNDDGSNDYFTLFGGPAARGIKDLKIFNRWGGLVFEGTDLPMSVEQKGWDGTFKGQDMNSAVFVFVAEVEFLDGEVVVFKGDLSLIR